MGDAPVHVTHVSEHTRQGSTTTRFEGGALGVDASFYISRDAPGHGPGLHQHPYPETFIVEVGRVRFRVGDETLEAGAGDIIVVPANTPHGFTCIGDEPMRSINIHPVGAMQQLDLE